MFGMIKNVKHFISFHYLRYLVATELYMVETWERVIIHVLMAVLFGLVWYFNHSIVMSAISQMRNVLPPVEQV